MSKARDIIFLNGLEMEAIIGIFDWERRVKQSVVIDLQMQTDTRAAAATDSIEDTLNYKAVAKRLLDFVNNSEFHLVETLAERVANDRLRSEARRYAPDVTGVPGNTAP